jgi:uncharacterized protein
VRLLGRKGRPSLRLFFTTDVHGSTVCFRKFINASTVFKAQVLVLGGDISGKRIVPLWPRPHGHWTAELGAQLQDLDGSRDVAEFKRRMEDSGMYAFEAGDFQPRDFQDRPELVEIVFVNLARERLADWLGLAQERLLDKDVRLIVNCGNDDPFELDTLIESAEGVELAEGRAIELPAELLLISIGYANLTPWRCARDVAEEELSRRISAAVAELPRHRQDRLVFNFHCPPFDSGLDTAAQLTDDLAPVTDGGQPVLVPVGSTAVRDAIERYHPLLGLHGHVHESRGAVRIDGSLCLNPGSEYPEGILRGALVDFSDAGVWSYVLTSG